MIRILVTAMLLLATMTSAVAQQPCPWFDDNCIRRPPPPPCPWFDDKCRRER